MGRSGFGSRLAAALVVACALGAIGPVGGAAAFNNKERKAVDIKGAEGASTSTAAFAEIRFKGNYQEEQGTGGLKRVRTTIELIPEQGATTVITDRGSSRRPKDARTGTPGFFDLGRDGRTISLLVEDLPTPAAQLRVTTSRPGAGSRLERRRGLGGIIDAWDSAFLEVSTPEELEAEIKESETHLEQVDENIEDIENRLDDVNKEIGKAQRAVNNAESPAEAKRAQKRLEKLEGKERSLLDHRRVLRDAGNRLERWIKDLKGELQARTRQCSDTADNDNDGAVDLADKGCVDAADNDEKDEKLSLTCPTPGGTTSPFAVINTPQSNEIHYFDAKNLATLMAVLNAPVTSPVGTPSEPAPVPGDICGPEIDVTFQYVVFTDGDPFSLPDPPPGQQGFCLFINAENPTGSGNSGGQDASLSLALGTAPK